MFEGVITALATPFKGGQVDFESLHRLVEWQMESGVDGFVINGTTGESPTLIDSEVEEIWNRVKSWVPQGFTLLLGTGSNCTARTIEKTRRAKELGAEGALIVVPYYNKPTQEGLYQHFSKVAEENPEMPILLYNVPGRTVISMAADTVERLSRLPNIVGIKEASGDLELGQKIIQGCRKDFTVTSGDDLTCIDLTSAGGKGVISVISHLIPKDLKTLIRQAKENPREVKEEYRKYSELNHCLGSEPNPIPVKMALYKMGIFSSPEMRLPLTTMDESNGARIEVSLRELGVIR